MRLITDDGLPMLTPIDFFMGAKPFSEWIVEATQDGGDIEELKKRTYLFCEALKIYEKATGIFTCGLLRHEPFVCTNYDYSEGDSPKVSYWFLFKEDNNGNTYRIFHEEVRA